MNGRVVCAAMKMEDGLIVAGVRHYSPDMRETLFKMYGEGYHKKVVEQGFIDNRSQFLSREQAFILAKQNDQLIRHPIKILKTELFSEDIY